MTPDRLFHLAVAIYLFGLAISIGSTAIVLFIRDLRAHRRHLALRAELELRHQLETELCRKHGLTPPPPLPPSTGFIFF